MEHRRCCFAGHGQLSYGEDVYEKLIEVLKRLVTDENVTEFFVGNYGSFDSLCAKAVRHIKEEFPHINLTLVIPYLTKEIENNKDYFNSAFDSILVADMPENTPKAIKILKCNEYMVRKSEFVVAYVKYSFGGAYKAIEFAQRKGKKEINIA